ncbi:transcription factor 19-like protein [Plakobranchus ocellatus]|uniref:Transcription factor 19-like protein n=1 Tax=Plakobranchus ocellatus TaxID=259542 RepID=A0AAV3ZNW3_9GAST|nr:transcription factor 19-like protein [Plakobranchus ocellatus]
MIRIEALSSKDKAGSMKVLKEVGAYAVDISTPILKEEGSVSVGRGPKADFFLDSAVTLRLISRIHAFITGFKGKDSTPTFTILNNGLNGTYINDIKMGYLTDNKCVLQQGDKITFGHPGCASIEAGEYAPQDDSEFQFIVSKQVAWTPELSAPLSVEA